MSKIDQKYIDNLQIFTKALEGLVEQLKSQQKGGTSDVVNEMLGNIPTDQLSMIVEEQKKLLTQQQSIKADTTKIVNDISGIKTAIESQKQAITNTYDKTEEILQRIKDVKSQKETGMFGTIESGDNRNKVVSAVKSIILIAGGVLAIGMAFKLVGNVDFTSVVGLSLGILIMVQAFKTISEMDIGVTDMVFAGLMLTIVAGSLLASSYILSMMPTMSIEQGITLLLVAGSLGLATWLILKGVNQINIKKDWSTILLLPLMLPLIATGIWLSSYILAQVQPISWQQALSIAITGVAIGIASLAVGLAIRGMKGVTWKEILAIPIVIPLIALGITLSSLIFNGAFGLPGFQPIKDPMGLLKGSLVIGLSILIFVPALILIGKFIGSNIAALGVGLLGIVGIAVAMVATSWIFTYGLPDKKLRYPDIAWSFSVGLGMLAFLPALIIFGAIAMTGVGALLLLAGAASILGLSAVMVGVASILNEGIFDKFPSIWWALGVGISLVAFSAAALIAIPAMIASNIMQFFGADDPLISLAQSMVDVSITLQKGIWNGNYPSLLWATGVGAGLLAFAAISVGAAAGSLVSGILNFFSGDDDPIGTLAQSMVDVSITLQKGVWNGNYPSLEWTLGVGAGLLAFGGITVGASATSLVSGVMNFFSGDNDPLGTLAQSMVDVSITLQKGVWGGNFPSLEWSSAVGAGLVAFGAITVGASATSLVSGVLSFFSGDDDPIGTLAQSMVDVSIKLSTGNFSLYPEPIWIDNISYGLLGIAKVIDEVDLDMDDMENFNYFLTNVLPNFQNLSNFPNLDPFVENVNKFVGVVNSIPDNKHEAIKNLSESIRDFSDALREVDMSTLDKLSTISQGVLLVSIIDEAKLRGVLDAMTEKQAELKEIYGDEEKEGVLSKFGNWASGLMGSGEEREKTSTVAVVKDDKDLDREAFYSNIAAIRSMMQNMIDMLDSPGQSGSFNK